MHVNTSPGKEQTDLLDSARSWGSCKPCLLTARSSMVALSGKRQVRGFHNGSNIPPLGVNDHGAASWMFTELKAAWETALVREANNMSSSASSTISSNLKSRFGTLRMAYGCACFLGPKSVGLQPTELCKISPPPRLSSPQTWSVRKIDHFCQTEFQ